MPIAPPYNILRFKFLNLEAKIYRSNLAEEKIRQIIQDEQIRIEVTGQQVGQINGLAVYSIDDYRFGTPTRITVTTYRGTKGLINIQREAKLSGNTLILGTEILQGFFYERYGQKKPVGFEGRIVFEQNYGLIDGPSATAAQLLALLSSLSQKPILQSMAITGTIDQKGNVGVIGGVNEKVESFFGICKTVGLTGKQGVIIPRTNLQHLILSEEVKNAVQDGQFHIYAISTIDEGVQILMDCQMAVIDRIIKDRLKAWNSNRANKKD